MLGLAVPCLASRFVALSFTSPHLISCVTVVTLVLPLYFYCVPVVLPLLLGGSAVAAWDRAGVHEGVPGGAARGKQNRTDQTSEAS